MGTVRRFGSARWAIAAAAAAAAALLSSSAAAQLDTNPPLPSVLLVVDSSGSMEQMPDGTYINDTQCVHNDSGSPMNKWNTLQQVLTGTVQNRGCTVVDRSSAAFTQEYDINGLTPYDFGYRLPFHRLVSADCVYGPGTLPVDPYDWTDPNVHDFLNPAVPCNGGGNGNKVWQQYADGILDAYRDSVRFGLMMFDSQISGATGLAGGSADVQGGFNGHWSYYLNWQGGGAPQQGYPPGCTSNVYEVGARNQVAPSWEGRAIGFGHYDESIADIHTINDQIQNAILMMRPYGGTPLAGMMSDAWTFFHLDTSQDHYNNAYEWAPPGDPYFNGGCRSSYIIVLSDGDPNMDMRTACEASGGVCPYKHAYEYAYDLAHPSDPKTIVQTFAVGFGISNVSGTDCRKLVMPNDYNAGGKCVGATGALKACCELSRLAYEGGTGQAYFADNTTELKTALSNVLSQVAAGATSRTTPVFGSTSGLSPNPGQAPAVGWQFTSSLTPRIGELWTGNLERHRWNCQTVNGALQPVLQDVDPNKGDDFAKDINQGKVSTPRTFFTVIADPGIVGFPDSWTSIRPYLTTDDGVGLLTGTTYSGTYDSLANQVQSYPMAMGVNQVKMPAQCSDPQLNASNAGDCAKRLAVWLLGGTNTGCIPIGGSGSTACPTRSGSEFGAVYHGTPALSTPPVAHVRDEDYTTFASKWAARPTVLYTETTDGQIHAHKVQSNNATDTRLVDNLDNNELWSFIPPMVLPHILGIYPNTQQELIDSPVVVKDVVLERPMSQALAAGTGSGATWSTVLLISGFATGDSGGSFYTALDVTNPDPNMVVDGKSGGPKFLWQISKTVSTLAIGGGGKGKKCIKDAGNTKKCVKPPIRGDQTLFGDDVPAPGIASIALKDGTDIKETAVAVLAGGSGVYVYGKDKLPGTCAVTQTDFSAISTYKPRTNVSCYEPDPDRSVYIVRIKDGMLLRVFTADSSLVPTGIPDSLITIVPFDSPLTGIPVPFPADTGQTANRVYVGDMDGRLWRLDLANPDPAQWHGELIFDAYPLPNDTPITGQPVMGYPIVSYDEVGNAVIIFSTGIQKQINYQAGQNNRVWSITEKPVPSGTYNYTIVPNWFEPYTDAARTTGPISVFDGVAYWATYTPSPVNNGQACSSGYGSLWGVSYKQAQDLGAGPRPYPRLPKDPNASSLSFVDHLDQASGSVIYGVAVTAQPPCFNSATTSDAFVGSHSSITGSTAPTFSLLYHTGNTGAAYGGTKAVTRAATMQLASPRQFLKFDSWASVAE